MKDLDAGAVSGSDSLAVGDDDSVVRPRILALAGSARDGSYNRALLRIAATGAERAGAVVTLVDLTTLRLPLYDQDLERSEGFPETVLRLKALLSGHQGFLFASPEYNASIAAPMKNAIDWASRPLPDEGWKAAFAGKTAAIMSASPGELGGQRGLRHLREILASIHVLVLPQQVTVGKANEAFDEDGRPRDPALQTRAEGLGAALARLLQKLAAEPGSASPGGRTGPLERRHGTRSLRS